MPFSYQPTSWLSFGNQPEFAWGTQAVIMQLCSSQGLHGGMNPCPHASWPQTIANCKGGWSLSIFLCFHAECLPRLSGLCPDLLCHWDGLHLGVPCPDSPTSGAIKASVRKPCRTLSPSTALKKQCPQPWEGPKLWYASLLSAQPFQKHDLHHNTHAKNVKVSSIVREASFSYQSSFTRSYQHHVCQGLRTVTQSNTAHSIGHGNPDCLLSLHHDGSSFETLLSFVGCVLQHTKGYCEAKEFLVWQGQTRKALITRKNVRNVTLCKIKPLLSVWKTTILAQAGVYFPLRPPSSQHHWHEAWFTFHSADLGLARPLVTL